MPQMTACQMPQGQRGGYGTIRPGDAAKLHFPISLIPFWLPATHRPHPCRSRQKGEDDSDPPKKRGVM